jgi:cation transport protein ChaC
VLGLDRGGACRGVAYLVAAKERAETIAYLREREQTTKVYLETMRRVILQSKPQRQVSALVYVIDRHHPQYAGRLDLDRQLHLVRQGHGRSGPNREYVLSTVKALEALGYRDHELHLLAERLRGLHESADESANAAPPE